jgi:hypothetical protein
MGRTPVEIQAGFGHVGDYPIALAWTAAEIDMFRQACAVENHDSQCSRGLMAENAVNSPETLVSS